MDAEGEQEINEYEFGGAVSHLNFSHLNIDELQIPTNQTQQRINKE